MDSMTITEFLEARIAEDEGVARAAIDPECPGTHWQWVTDKTDTVVAPGDLEDAQEHQRVSLRTREEYVGRVGALPAFVLPYVEDVLPGPGEHIAHWDPARVLAECEAKRRILDLHESWPVLVEQTPTFGAGTWPEEAALRATQRIAWLTTQEYRARFGDEPPTSSILRAIALPYADHPDYQEVWKP